MSSPSPFSVIVLAAGMGTRMRSDMHKVLHPIAGKPMLMHLLDTVDSLGAKERVVVVGKGRDQLEEALERGRPTPSSRRKACFPTSTAMSYSSMAIRLSWPPAPLPKC